MGNCFAFRKLCEKNPCSPISATTKKFARVIKTNGKIFEHSMRPKVVKVFLTKFSGYGKDHYHPFTVNDLTMPSTVVTDHSPNSMSTDSSTGTKRIKLIVTKQQLQELLLKKTSIEDMCLLGIRNVAWCGLNSSSRWRPVLETIPEERG